MPDPSRRHRFIGRPGIRRPNPVLTVIGRPMTASLTAACPNRRGVIRHQQAKVPGGYRLQASTYRQAFKR